MGTFSENSTILLEKGYYREGRQLSSRIRHTQNILQKEFGKHVRVRMVNYCNFFG